MQISRKAVDAGYDKLGPVALAQLMATCNGGGRRASHSLPQRIQHELLAATVEISAHRVPLSF